jgi:hypothetical protein
MSDMNQEGPGRDDAPPPMSLDRVFSNAWHVFTGSFLVLVVFGFVASLPTSLPPEVMGLEMDQQTMQVEAWGLTGWLVLLSVLLTPFCFAAMIVASAGAYRGSPVGLGNAAGVAIDRYVPLLIATILFTLGVLAGLVLLIVPGIILMLIWAVTYPVVVLEEQGPVPALGRSRALTKGSRLKIFLIGAIFWVLATVATSIAGLILGLLPAALMTVVGAAISGIVNAFWVALGVVVYYDLIEKRELLDRFGD